MRRLFKDDQNDWNFRGASSSPLSLRIRNAFELFADRKKSVTISKKLEKKQKKKTRKEYIWALGLIKAWAFIHKIILLDQPSCEFGCLFGLI